MYKDEPGLFASEKLLDSIFVDNHFFVRVFARLGVFNALHHLDVVTAGTCVSNTLSNPGVLRNFLSHSPKLL